ncbi:TRZ/ATZ family hydrolase [Tepidiphilus olei]|uniref:TRZ/ATZ family hydrolase n=1 Tax=Tepidiphilus olei TaxID=2502184 RepID=UPI00115F14AE|nr:TRZ/ATZ family hydrolase [Tepidiphilus olei]
MPEPTALQSADTLILPRWLLPMEPAGALLTGHAVAVRGDTILDVGPADELERRWRPRERVELPEHVLLPGLINAHTHAAMTLLRGVGDDLPLRRWLEEAIWPREAALMSEEFVHDGTLIAAAEMLRGGITTAVDMYFYPEAAARAFTALGMRAVLGITAIDFPTPYAADADEALAKGLAVRDAWREEPLVSFVLAPHAPYSVSDETLERIATLAAQLDLPVQIHLLEAAQEREESLARHGETPLQRLDRMGLLGQGLIGVHAVHLTESEIALLAERGAALVHCPTSNMKLASGIAAVPRWLEAGIPVGLGTDGAASNNRLDLFQEMRHAALLAKVGQGRADVLPAMQILELATIDAARALGLEHRLGSIRPGKAADLVAVALDAVETQPCYDPCSHLVFVAGREHVSDVWVAGRRRVSGKILLLQENNRPLSALAQNWRQRIQLQIR